jgi:hypothetical protein
MYASVTLQQTLFGTSLRQRAFDAWEPVTVQMLMTRCCFLLGDQEAQRQEAGEALIDQGVLQLWAAGIALENRHHCYVSTEVALRLCMSGSTIIDGCFRSPNVREFSLLVRWLPGSLFSGRPALCPCRHSLRLSTTST